MTISEIKPTPFPSDPAWVKALNSTTGSTDIKVQQQLSKEMQLSYRAGVGKLIWQ
jgi:hypothetical protein